MKKTVGDLLREARNKKGLALQTIERSTGIATHHLLAIELDQFSLIEADKFDGYLRAYAEAVDLDYNDLRKDCDVQTTEPVVEPAPTPVTSFDDLVAETKPDYVPQELPPRSERRYSRSERGGQSAAKAPKKAKKAKKKSALPGIIFGLLLIGGLVYAAIKFDVYNKYIADLLPKTTKTSTAPSKEEVEETPESSAPAVVEGAQLAVTGGGESIEVVVTNAAQPLKVDISLTAQDGSSSWVALTNSDLGEGGTTLNLDQPSYTATFTEGATEGLLTLGITQGIAIKIDGKELDLSALTTTATSFITIKVQ